MGDVRNRALGDTEAQVGRLLRSYRGRLPEGVRGVEAKYGTDSGGEPAIWLIVDVDDDAAPSEDKLDRFNRFALSMKSKLLAAGVEAWPYVQFRSS